MEDHDTTQLDELIPLARSQEGAIKLLPNRSHVSALWRWSRIGVRGRNGERVRLQIARIGMRIDTTEASRRPPRRLGTQAGSGSWLTNEVYAERDLQRVAEVMKRMG